jgi:radical SAM protein with 4Fe4S-binding SPASM domain
MKIISKSNNIEALSSLFKKYSHIMTKRLSPQKVLNIGILLLEMKLRKAKLKSYPIIARINACPVCNLRCPGCMGKGNPNSSKHIMTIEEYRDIIDRVYENLVLVILYDEGEPLLNKDIYKMVRYTSKLNISTNISSNLSLKFSDKNIEDLVLSDLDRLRVGIDGMSQEVYEQYRIGGNLELVKSNLRKIITTKRKYNREYPILEIQYLNFGYNAHQIEDAMYFAQSVGVDEFNTFRAYPDDLWVDNECSEIDRVKQGCSGLWMTLYINNDGMVFPCNYGEDTGINPIGSVFKTDLAQLWNDSYMQDLRKSLHRKNKHLKYEHCRKCPISQSLPWILR